MHACWKFKIILEFFQFKNIWNYSLFSLFIESVFLVQIQRFNFGIKLREKKPKNLGGRNNFTRAGALQKVRETLLYAIFCALVCAAGFSEERWRTCYRMWAYTVVRAQVLARTLLHCFGRFGGSTYFLILSRRAAERFETYHMTRLASTLWA